MTEKKVEQIAPKVKAVEPPQEKKNYLVSAELVNAITEHLLNTPSATKTPNQIGNIVQLLNQSKRV